MSTAKFESAQALFCAIADFVGKDNIDKVLNMTEYPTYEKFEGGTKRNITNRFRIDEAAAFIDTTSNLADIEDFLKKEPSWYKSSVLIAKTLINSLEDIDGDFKDLAEAGFLKGPKSMYYLRGDKTVMDEIQKLFDLANKAGGKLGQTRFGDVNKWSPADIYYANGFGKKQIAEHHTAARSSKSYTFSDLNDKIASLIDSGSLLPLSLKKSTKNPKLYPINFDIAARDKQIDGVAKKGGVVDGGLWYNQTASLKNGDGNLWTKYEPVQRFGYSPYEPYGIDKVAREKNKNSRRGSRDVVLFVSDNMKRNNKLGKIQMRHDATGNSWKVDFTYSGGESRGGSIVSADTFGDILGTIDSAVGDKFKSAFKTGQSGFSSGMSGKFEIMVGPKKQMMDFQTLTGNGLKAHRPQLDADFINAVKIDTSNTVFGIKYAKEDVMLAEPGVMGQNPYTNLRGELAGREVMNRVGPILTDFLSDDKNTKVAKSMTHSNVDKFIRVLFRYVTSQAPSSAQFVIAK